METDVQSGPCRTGSPAVRGFFALAAAASFLWYTGCSTASPRFGSSSKPPRQSSPGGSVPRFASREAEEERREDDKRPDTAVVKSVTSGVRSFKTEKNPAIQPLDQSKMMREISRYMGVPYALGRADKDGMDCSGYTMTVYKSSVGKSLPRTSSGQAKFGRSVKLSDLQFGDLLFFNTTGEEASHVGIYIGDDLFAHASVSQGVTISSLQSSYYEKRYEGARRIIEQPPAQ